ncbi:uncharacterized protein LOC62_03G004687 [Vanrija pseudolonga]|uniref:Wings apart-like protein C-terminal domain-containing protein n=1 Tax=Vanrija pseudolonga TaxID=143232 RepID=A0AAF0YAM5_9TREE|nr:hypothetical protein LOC62_03G004687 [Vanrija pseudolonga]
MTQTLPPMTPAQERSGKDELVQRAMWEVAGGIVGAAAPPRPPRRAGGPPVPGSDAWRAEGQILQQSLIMAVWRAIQASTVRDLHSAAVPAAAGGADALMRLRAARANARAGLLASVPGAPRQDYLPAAAPTSALSMITSPPPPVSRPPPKRTYGRRGRVPRVAADTDSDTDTDSDGDGAPAAAGPSRNLPSAPKKARTRSPSPTKPGSKTPLARSASASSAATPSSSTSSSSLARTFSHPAVTVQPPSSSVKSSISSATKSFAQRTRNSDSPTRARSPRLREQRDPPSRPQSPRDLSDIFGAVSPSRNGESQESSSSSNGAAGRPRPKSGLRRMLSKAQSMLVPPAPPEAPSTPRALRTTQSMPITPTSGKSDRSGVSLEAAGSPTPAALVAPAVAVESPGSGGRAQRTYGRSRTFLSSRPADDDTGEGAASSLAASLAEPPRESYEELRKRYEVDNETGGSGNLLDALLARAPVPISDMRSKGENRRFMDEVTFLLEGISNAPSKGIRRTSSVDVLKNMQDATWVHKMDICGQTDRVWDVLRSARNADDSDEVMEAVCLLFLDILVGSGEGVSSVLQTDAGSVVELLARNIGLRTGPLDAAYPSKVTPVVSNLRAIYRSFAGDEDEFTTRRAASRVLVNVCETAWATVEPLTPGSGVVPRAFGALVAEIQPLSARLPLYAKGLDLLPKDAGAVDLVFLEQCLQALVTIVTDSSSRSEIAAETDRYRLAAVVDVVALMAAVALTDEDEDLRRRASQCTVLALQLLRPLVSPLAQREDFGAQPGTVTALGRVLLGREKIVASLQDSPARTDADGPETDNKLSPDELTSLVLALFGSMDLDEPDVAKLLAETAISDCTKRSCAVSCRCSGHTLPLAEALTHLYCDYSSRTDDALGSFLHGYLAYLLTKLLTMAPGAAGPLILPGLPGDATRAKLDGLHSTLSDLVSLSTVVHRKLQEPSQGLNGSLESVASDNDDEGLSRALHDLQELRQQPPWP